MFNAILNSSFDQFCPEPRDSSAPPGLSLWTPDYSAPIYIDESEPLALSLSFAGHRVSMERLPAGTRYLGDIGLSPSPSRSGTPSTRGWLAGPLNYLPQAPSPPPFGGSCYSDAVSLTTSGLTDDNSDGPLTVRSGNSRVGVPDYLESNVIPVPIDDVRVAAINPFHHPDTINILPDRDPVEAAVHRNRMRQSPLLARQHSTASTPAIAPHIIVLFDCPLPILDCRANFKNERTWENHALQHFRDVTPPKHNRCSMCHREFNSDIGIQSWRMKMDHTVQHHYAGQSLEKGEVYQDWELHEYLFREGLMTHEQWKFSNQMKSAWEQGVGWTRHIDQSAGQTLTPPHSPDRGHPPVAVQVDAGQDQEEVATQNGFAANEVVIQTNDETRGEEREARRARRRAERDARRNR